MQVTPSGSYPRTEPVIQPAAVRQNPLNALASSASSGDVAILHAALTAAMEFDFLLGWPNAPQMFASPAIPVAPGMALAQLPAKMAEQIAALPGMAHYGPDLMDSRAETLIELSPEQALHTPAIVAPTSAPAVSTTRAALAIDQYKALLEAQPDVTGAPPSKPETTVGFPHWPVLDLAQKTDMPQRLTGTERTAERKPLRVRAASPQFERVRSFCRRLPILAILLAWLAVGFVAGLLALPFEHGPIAEIRHIVFPVWAMGCLALIVFAFLRSSLRFLRRNAW